jgi:PAS domain-containing protein
MASSADPVRPATPVPRTLTDDVFDALPDGVLVVDSQRDQLPLILANASARRCLLGDPESASLTAVSAAAGAPAHGVEGYSALLLTPTSATPREVFIDATGVAALAVLSVEVAGDRLHSLPAAGYRLWLALDERPCDLINVWDYHARLQHVSGGMAERRGQSLFELVHPDDLEALRSAFAALVAGRHDSFAMRYRTRHRDGSYRWLEASFVSALANPMLAGAVIAARDITAVQRAPPRPLAASTDWLKLSMTLGQPSAWRWIRDGDQVEFALGDADTGAVRHALELGIERHADVTVECRLKSAGGRYRSFRAVARPTINVAGRVSGLGGVTQDIAARRELEISLGHAEELLRTTWANTLDTLLRVDADLTIRFVSGDVLGRSAQSLVNEPIAVLLPDGVRQAITARLREVLATGEPATYEFATGAAGAGRCIENRAARVRGAAPGGSLSIVMRDVTEHRRVQREIRDVADRSRDLYGLQVDFRGKLADEAGLGEVASSHLCRIVQEAVTNTAKHGHATRLRIPLAVSRDQFPLRISDDGVGVAGDAAAASRMGLKTMKYRAGLIGALDVRGPRWHETTSMHSSGHAN